MVQYAQTSRDSFPKIPPPTITSGVLATNDGGSGVFRNLDSANEDNPFDTSHYDPSADGAPVSACLWLLCRTEYSPVDPDLFVCPSVKRKAGVEDPLRETDGKKRGARYFSDFLTTSAGPLITYSFHNPWIGPWDTTSPDPGFIVGGDENNGSDVLATHRVPPVGAWAPDPDKTNSDNHDRVGQNIADSNGSVQFTKNVHSGLNRDHVYTSYREAAGTNPLDYAGICDVRPSGDYFDTVLVPVEDSSLHIATDVWETSLD